jgi:hypothetical protein
MAALSWVATLIAPYVNALVNEMVNGAGLGGTEAGRSLANIVSGGIVMGLTSAIGGGDAAAYAGAEFRYNYLTHQQLEEALAVRRRLVECTGAASMCTQDEIAALVDEDSRFMALSRQNTASLLTICQAAPSSDSCARKIADLQAFAAQLDADRAALNDPYRSASGFSHKQSFFDYDLLLADSLQKGSAPDVAIRDFLTDLARKEGAVNAFLDTLGIVGGVAACGSGAGTAVCVAGALAAVASANHLSGDIRKAVTGQEAKTAFVAALMSQGYTQEQAEQYQHYVDIGVIVVGIGAGGYKFAVDAKRLAKGDEALAGLNGAPNTGATNVNNGIRLNHQLAAEQIAGGHGFEKHVISQGEFAGLGIRTRQHYQDHIENVLNNPSSVRYALDGRSFHLQESTGTVVVRNPNARDGGTAFQPQNWNDYVSQLPTRTEPY